MGHKLETKKLRELEQEIKGAAARMDPGKKKKWWKPF